MYIAVVVAFRMFVVLMVCGFACCCFRRSCLCSCLWGAWFVFSFDCFAVLLFGFWIYVSVSFCCLGFMVYNDFVMLMLMCVAILFVWV